MPVAPATAPDAGGTGPVQLPPPIFGDDLTSTGAPAASTGTTVAATDTTAPPTRWATRSSPAPGTGDGGGTVGGRGG